MPTFGTQKSKWGRHCCRPHSHRAWSLLLRPSLRIAAPEAHLAPGVFPSFRPVLAAGPDLRFCHRRSHRHPVRSWRVGRPVPRPSCDFRVSLGSGLSGSFPRLASPFGRPSSGAIEMQSTPTVPSVSDRFFQPVIANFALASTLRSFPAEAFFDPKLFRCVDSSHHAELVSKIPLFQSLKTETSKSLSPFRCLETAPRSRVGQGLQARVIPAARFSLWTAVENSTVRRRRALTLRNCGGRAVSGEGHSGE